MYLYHVAVPPCVASSLSSPQWRAGGAAHEVGTAETRTLTLHMASPDAGGAFFVWSNVEGSRSTASSAIEHLPRLRTFDARLFNAMDFTKLDGLIPVVVQDEDSNEVLMVGFMNAEALAETRRSGFATFFSRTRGKLWTKGETSGNRLAVQRVMVDCDDDTVLLRVKRLGDGNVCHTGERSCFFKDLTES